MPRKLVQKRAVTDTEDEKFEGAAVKTNKRSSQSQESLKLDGAATKKTRTIQPISIVAGINHVQSTTKDHKGFSEGHKVEFLSLPETDHRNLRWSGQERL
jgi:urate oxidase